MLLGDHTALLRSMPDESADVVFFDVMFREPSKAKRLPAPSPLLCHYVTCHGPLRRRHLRTPGCARSPTIGRSARRRCGRRCGLRGGEGVGRLLAVGQAVGGVARKDDEGEVGG